MPFYYNLRKDKPDQNIWNVKVPGGFIKVSGANDAQLNAVGFARIINFHKRDSYTDTTPPFHKRVTRYKKITQDDGTIVVEPYYYDVPVAPQDISDSLIRDLDHSGSRPIYLWGVGMSDAMDDTMQYIFRMAMIAEGGVKQRLKLHGARTITRPMSFEEIKSVYRALQTFRVEVDKKREWVANNWYSKTKDNPNFNLMDVMDMMYTGECVEDIRAHLPIDYFLMRSRSVEEMFAVIKDRTKFLETPAVQYLINPFVPYGEEIKIVKFDPENELHLMCEYIANTHSFETCKKRYAELEYFDKVATGLLDVSKIDEMLLELNNKYGGVYGPVFKAPDFGFDKIYDEYLTCPACKEVRADGPSTNKKHTYALGCRLYVDTNDYTCPACQHHVHTYQEGCRHYHKPILAHTMDDGCWYKDIEPTCQACIDGLDEGHTFQEGCRRYRFPNPTCPACAEEGDTVVTPNPTPEPEPEPTPDPVPEPTPDTEEHTMQEGCKLYEPAKIICPACIGISNGSLTVMPDGSIQGSLIGGNVQHTYKYGCKEYVLPDSEVTCPVCLKDIQQPDTQEPDPTPSVEQGEYVIVGPSNVAYQQYRAYAVLDLEVYDEAKENVLETIKLAKWIRDFAPEVGTWFKFAQLTHYGMSKELNEKLASLSTDKTIRCKVTNVYTSVGTINVGSTLYWVMPKAQTSKSTGEINKI